MRAKNDLVYSILNLSRLKMIRVIDITIAVPDCGVKTHRFT